MKDGVMINAQAYHDTSLSNLLLTEKCSTGLSFGVFLFFIKLVIQGKERPRIMDRKNGSMEWVFLSSESFCQLQVKLVTPGQKDKPQLSPGIT